MAQGQALRYAQQLDCRPWLDMPAGRRVYIVGDLYTSEGGRAPAPVGVFDRATRGIWLRPDVGPPLARNISLWSLVGLARAMGRDAAQVRAQLAAGGAPGFRPVRVDELEAWFRAGGPGEAAP